MQWPRGCRSQSSSRNRQSRASGRKRAQSMRRGSTSSSRSAKSQMGAAHSRLMEMASWTRLLGNRQSARRCACEARSPTSGPPSTSCCRTLNSRPQSAWPAEETASREKVAESAREAARRTASHSCRRAGPSREDRSRRQDSSR